MTSFLEIDMSQQMLTPELESEAETTTMPSELDSSASKLVYLYLKTAGECTVSELQASLDMKKISLYPLLKTLSKQNLVDRDGERYSLA